MENLATLNVFFGGKDESWFYLTTVEIEARGGRAVVPIMLATEAIAQYNNKINNNFRTGCDDYQHIVSDSGDANRNSMVK